MVKCTFCGRDETPLRGIHFVTNIGVVEYYCSSKCRKNAIKLKRDKRSHKWTEAFRIARDKTRAAQELKAAKPVVKK